MRRLLIALCIAFSIGFLQPLGAQTLNWAALKDSRHVMSMGLGWDYGISFALGYAYRVNTPYPLMLKANFSIPAGEGLIDDHKAKVGAQVLLLNKPYFKGSMALCGIYRRFENPLMRMINFGSELSGAFGYYRLKWFVAGEIGFDKAIINHYKHSASFKEMIYQDVQDGWYGPSTGGNFYYGSKAGISSKKSDVTFRIGMIRTQDFKSTPLIPYYLMLGYNFRFSG